MSKSLVLAPYFCQVKEFCMIITKYKQKYCMVFMQRRKNERMCVGSVRPQQHIRYLCRTGGHCWPPHSQRRLFIPQTNLKPKTTIIKTLSLFLTVALFAAVTVRRLRRIDSTKVECQLSLEKGFQKLSDRNSRGKCFAQSSFFTPQGCDFQQIDPNLKPLLENACYLLWDNLRSSVCPSEALSQRPPDEKHYLCHLLFQSLLPGYLIHPEWCVNELGAIAFVSQSETNNAADWEMERQLLSNSILRCYPYLL